MHRPATNSWRTGVLCLVPILALAADPGSGVLAGRWKATADGGEEPVRVAYHREAQGEGRISMQLGPEGERFVGQYLRLGGGRDPGRVRTFYTVFAADEFDRFGYGPAGRRWVRREVTFEVFQSRYSGAVVATLTGDRGSQMRCHFELQDAKSGLPGGATGRCQSTSGDVVEVGRPPPPR